MPLTLVASMILPEPPEDKKMTREVIKSITANNASEIIEAIKEMVEFAGVDASVVNIEQNHFRSAVGNMLHLERETLTDNSLVYNILI